MNECLECKSKTKNKKFCSSSCSATANNRKFPKRIKKNVKCRKCKIEPVLKPGRVCSSCNTYSKRLYVNKNWDELSTDWSRRKRLIELRGNKCEICFIEEWLGKPAPVEIDHIDGDHSNNDISNVRILCCMCHAQTITYCRPNKRKLL